MTYIGIDPGQNNGFAKYHQELELKTLDLGELFLEFKELDPDTTIIHIENPGLWKNFKNVKNANKRLQGAGNVKGTYTHITKELTRLGFTYKAMRPDKIRNSYASANNLHLFQKITGYTMSACPVAD